MLSPPDILPEKRSSHSASPLLNIVAARLRAEADRPLETLLNVEQL